MCGQFAVLGSLKAIKDYYQFLSEGDFSFENVFLEEDNYQHLNANYTLIKPMDYFTVVTVEEQKIILLNARWGLVPFWAKDESFAIKTINARIESLKDKPTFKYAYEKRRCLIPFTGFYERDKVKTQHYFPNDNNALKSFAGLYEIWGKDKLITFTIITCPANEKVALVHQRMPVVLDEDKAKEWLAS